jgi:hypothetical protein
MPKADIVKRVFIQTVSYTADRGNKIHYQKNNRKII